MTFLYTLVIRFQIPDDLIRTDNPLWLLGIPPFSAETHFFVVDLFLKLVKKIELVGT